MTERENMYSVSVSIFRIIRPIQYIEVSQKMALIKYHDDKITKAFETISADTPCINPSK
jgi:hypothetical protein